MQSYLSEQNNGSNGQEMIAGREWEVKRQLEGKIKFEFGAEEDAMSTVNLLIRKCTLYEEFEVV